jgi:hypothetical protein
MNKEDADRLNSCFEQTNKEVALLRVRVNNLEKYNIQNSLLMNRMQEQIGKLISSFFNNKSTKEQGDE